MRNLRKGSDKVVFLLFFKKQRYFHMCTAIAQLCGNILEKLLGREIKPLPDDTDEDVSKPLWYCRPLRKCLFGLSIFSFSFSLLSFLLAILLIQYKESIAFLLLAVLSSGFGLFSTNAYSSNVVISTEGIVLPQLLWGSR